MTAPMTAVWMPGRSQKLRTLGVAPGSPPPGAWALSGWVSIAMGVLAPFLRLFRVGRVVVTAAGAGQAERLVDLARRDVRRVVGERIRREDLGYGRAAHLRGLRPLQEVRH